MSPGFGAALLTALLALRPGPASAAGLSPADLPGWGADNQAAALAAFRTSCPQLTGREWQAACAAAAQVVDARAFFQRYFRAEPIGGAKSTLFTGYYEPEIPASPVRTTRYAFPIYRKPPGLVPGRPWFDRETIERQGLLNDKGLEIAWLQSPVDVFFLQIQGSGRLEMPDGKTVRVGFAAKNGQPYRSIGEEMVRRGLLAASQVSAQAIRLWIERHPEVGQELLWANPSYVFFRRVHLPAKLGPLGAMSVPLTPERSLAVDPNWVPLGAPVWVATEGPDAIHRLMVAQDSGSAIKSPQRADIFVGSGARAGALAGEMRDEGHMYVLRPRDMRDLLQPEAPK